MKLKPCKLCKKLGEKVHKQQELTLMKAADNWASGVTSNIKDWERLERAAMAYGRKPKRKQWN